MHRPLEIFADRLKLKLSTLFPFLIPNGHGGASVYITATVLIGIALFVRLAIAPVNAGLQYVTFFPAVTLSAYLGGIRSGLLATTLGAVLATIIFTPPYYSFSVEVLHFSLWPNLVFLMDGIILSISIEAMHQYRYKFEREIELVKKSEAQVIVLNAELEKQVSVRKQIDQTLIEKEEFFRLIAENVEDFITVLDLEGRRLYCSPSYNRLFGNLKKLEGTDSFAEIHPDDRERVKQVFSESVQYGISLRTEYRFVLPDGSIRHIESSNGLIKNNMGETMSVVEVSHDVTERKLVEQEINKLAFFDTLTQLPNRRLLDDRLEQAIASSKRSGKYGAVMFLDLDNFKPLNDTHGHKAGDLLLMEVSRRLVSCVREVDTIARFGGDEFVVVLNELDGVEQECASQAEIVAEKIRNALAGPYWLTSNSQGSTKMIIHHNLGASIGVVLFNSNANGDNILKCADRAMYQAKAAGRNQIRFCDAFS